MPKGKTKRPRESKAHRFRAPKSFAQRIKDQELFPIKVAAEITGYSIQHLRRLCHKRKVGHLKRGGNEFFFTPHDLEAVFAHIKAQA